MNLLLLAVWCGFLFSCTFSLPRKRQIKYPVTKIQNSHYERSHPTALEVLERTLLHPSDKKGKHCHLRSGRKRSAKHYIGRPTPPLSPLNSESSEDVSDKENNIVERCVASFGEQSPLCKPRRRQKKSFIGIPDIHKRLFRSNTETGNTSSAVPSISPEDFFGIFETSTEPIVGRDTTISKLNDPPKFSLSASTSLNTNEPNTSQAGSISQTSITQPVLTSRSTVQHTAAQVPVGVHLIGEPKIILPGSVQKIESEPQSLYVEEGDNSGDGKTDSHLDTSEEPGHEDVATEETKHEDVVTEETKYEDVNTIELNHEGDITAESNHEGDSTAESQTEGVITIDLKHEGATGSETSSFTHVTLSALKSSLLPGEVYSKTTCETEMKVHCICSFSTVDSDFRAIFSKAKNEEEIVEKISRMKCRHYIPKPSSIDLITNTKPRVLKGNHKPFAVDNSQGAKEVSEKSLDEYIAYSAVDDGVIRVFVSSNVKIPCFPKADIHLSASEADHVKYDWTSGDSKQVITQGRISEDPEGGGSLVIEDVELTDSMNYSCQIDYIHPDTGERTTDTFVHTLSVVTLPIVSARALVHYTSHAACDESLLELLEMYLPQQLERALCSPDRDRPPLCRVVVHSPVCHSDGQQGSMEMSLNFDVFIHRPASKTLAGERAKWCDPDCHLLISFKLLQMLREGVEEVAMTPVTSKVQDGGTFTPVAGSVKVKYIFGCIGGYYLDNGFCLACPRGMYSDDGATECKHCPLHTFSSKVGTRTCTPCQYVWMPICNEYFASVNVKIIIIVVAGVVLVIALFVCYYVFYYKGQTWKEVMTKGPKEKIARSEKMKFRRETKRLKDQQEAEAKKAEKEARKAAKEEEIKRLLQSSGESESESEVEKRIQFRS